MSSSTAPTASNRPRIEPAPASLFLAALDPACRWFTIQTFTDREDKPRPDPLAQVFNPEPARLLEFVQQRYEEGAGVWVTVNDTNGNGRKKSDVVRVRAVWQEDDDGYEGDFPLEPSLVNETSPGHYHRLW